MNLTPDEFLTLQNFDRLIREGVKDGVDWLPADLQIIDNIRRLI